jgi:thioredoxin-like negative regulator of GroEL
MEHDIQQITEKNFDGVIGKFRADSVAALWFFKDDNSDDKKFLDEYNKVGMELKGMAKITAMNCNQNAKFCTKNNVKQTPALMMYPTFPMDPFLWQGKMETKAVAGKIAKMIPDLSTVLTKENVDSWLSADISKPKMIIFSDKPKPPTIVKALSSDTVFKRTAKFGFVTKDEADVCQKFKITKFPAAILQRKAGNAVKKEEFKGKMSFEELHKFINPYVESGMGDKVQGSGGKEMDIEDDQPWLTQEVPELTAKSSNQICFKGEGLCVIYLKDGEASQSEVDMLAGLSKKYSAQNNKAKMKFMWINLAIESAFKDLFKADQLPSTVVFNPHKRLRFTKQDHGEDGSIKSDAAGISSLVDKVLGGDARFTNVPGQKLPAWVPRDPPKKEGKKEL